MMRKCDQQEEMLLRVQQYGFMTDDLRLYLNTHPDCEEALCLLRRYIGLECEAKRAYEQAYGSLTLGAVASQDEYDWIQEPWPWQAEV